MTEKEIIGLAAAAIGMLSYLIYIVQILRGQVRPHMFTWTIWGLLMMIGFAAQRTDAAGPGSWALGVSGLLTLLIAGMSYFHGEKNITRGDWCAFIAALSAIPVWLVTGSPLLAVIIATLIDMTIYYPTFRKSWMKPGEESVVVYFVMAVQFLLSLAAMENVTLTTALYPAMIVTMNMLLIILLLARRQVLR